MPASVYRSRRYKSALTAALRFFTQPMTEQTFDLSVETVRWEVYTQEGQRRTDLLPDGDAGYTGLSAPG